MRKFKNDIVCWNIENKELKFGDRNEICIEGRNSRI